MTPYQVARTHRFAGLALGAILALLALTGLLLDHEGFDFLWETRLDPAWLPSIMADDAGRDFTSYRHIGGRRYAGSRIGLYISDDGRQWRRSLKRQILALDTSRRPNESGEERHLFAATNDGIWISDDRGEHWARLALNGQRINALVAQEDTLYAVADKRRLYAINLPEGNTTEIGLRPPHSSGAITLSRLVRDLHYGRGLFDGDSSLLLNDWAALVLLFLSLSGFWIYVKIWRIRHRRPNAGRHFPAWRRWHSNSVLLLSFPLILLLLLTGIVLDHGQALRGLLKSIHLHTDHLPPVYRSLETDIWGIDYDGSHFRIGNRLGVFRSPNLIDWQLDSPGFAWRMKRIDKRLYVAGMGSPNRVLENGKWHVLSGTPHMPRDYFNEDGRIQTFTPGRGEQPPLPRLEGVSLYALLARIHDGSFFHPQWIWLNDLAAIAAILLFYTGYLKWRRKRRSHAARC